MIQVKLYEAGYCSHPECVVTGRFSCKISKFPMICTLIYHPKHGYILFDTGYCKEFFNAGKHFPYSLYNKVTPVKIPMTLKDQLAKDGILASEIGTIFVSHFHADHVSAIDDFPNARIYCSKVGYEYARHKKGLSALIKGILPCLMDKFAKRDLVFFEDLPESIAFHMPAFDLFGDKSLFAHPLPGHAIGQFGLSCAKTSYQDIFLVADAVWRQDLLINHQLPLWITRFLHDDHKAYLQTFELLYSLAEHYPALRIIPSHCHQTYLDFVHE